jgi:protein tyrosine phosphatase (PTP) superfamily phosphohydrolase (DUF442 family)
MTTELGHIYNFLQLEPRLATSGQPLEDELRQVAAAGYDVVINLALHDADYSLPDERRLVQSLGMVYEHLPVIWERPQLEDFHRFVELMRRHRDKKRYIHCAANMRVSTFVALWRIVSERWDRASAMAPVAEIWEPDDIWQRFIETVLADAAGTVKEQTQ